MLLLLFFLLSLLLSLLRLRSIAMSVYVCMYVCLSVCLSPRISQKQRPSFRKCLYMLPAAVECNTLCSSGFANDVIFSYNGASGLESKTTLCFVQFVRRRHRRRSCCLRLQACCYYKFFNFDVITFLDVMTF